MNQSELKQQAHKTLSKQSITQLQSKLDSGHFRGLSIDVAKEIIANRLNKQKLQDDKIEVEQIEVEEIKTVKTKLVKPKKEKKVENKKKSPNTKWDRIQKLLKTKRSVAEIAKEVDTIVAYVYKAKREMK